MRFAAVTVALVVAIGLALLAYQQSLAAESGRRTAEHEKQIADEQRNIAVGERGRAQKAAYDAEQARNEAVTAKDQAVKSAELEKIAREQADEARNEAEQNLIRSQAKTAAVESLRNIETDPAASVAFATRSLELFPSDEARSLLANALVNLPSFNSFQIHASPVKKGDVRFSTVKGMAEEIQFVEGGRYLVVRQKPGFVEVRDAVTGTTVRRIENVRPDTPWSMDGAHQRLSLILNDGSLTVLDFRQSSGVRELLKLAGPYALTTLSYDGEHVITVDGKGEVGLTSLQSRAFAPIYSGVTPVSLNVNRNMTRIVTLDGEGNTTIRALPAGTVVSSFKAEITKHVPDLGSEFKLLLETISQKSRNPIRDPNERPIPELYIVGRVTDLISKYVAEDPDFAKKLEENAKSFSKMTQKTGEAIIADDSSYTDIDKLLPEIARRILEKQFAPDCRPEIRFGLDDDVIFLACRSEALMFTELWDTKGTPKRVSDLSGLFGTFDMDADGSHLAVAGADSIVVYKVARQEDNGQLSFKPVDGWPIAYPDSRIGPPRELRFSPNGGILLALHAPFVLLQATPPATVSMWYTHPVDARDGNEHQGIKLHPHTILSTTSAFSPEANQIATYSVDGTIRVWRISRDRELFTVNGSLSDRAVTSLFKGYKYLPAETWDALNPLFPSDRSLLDAVQRVTRRSLTAEELQRFSLTAQKSTTKVAKSLSSRPTIPLKDLVTRPGQIAVQN
jgi:WD40 repeat protein